MRDRGYILSDINQNIFDIRNGNMCRQIYRKFTRRAIVQELRGVNPSYISIGEGMKYIVKEEDDSISDYTTHTEDNISSSTSEEMLGTDGTDPYITSSSEYSSLEYNTSDYTEYTSNQDTGSEYSTTTDEEGKKDVEQIEDRANRR